MATNQAASSNTELAQGTALAKLDDSSRRDLFRSYAEKAKANRKKLMWCGIGVGAAIAVPVFLYFAPHLF